MEERDESVGAEDLGSKGHESGHKPAEHGMARAHADDDGRGRAFVRARSRFGAKNVISSTDRSACRSAWARISRGTVIGFVRAAQDGNLQVAREYLQPAHGRLTNSNEQQELVDHLLAVLNARFPNLDAISRDADVRGEDGRLLSEITVDGARTTESFPLTLVRVDDPHFGRIWLISQTTLEEVPASYDSLRFPQLAQKLPSILVKTRALGMPLWQWLAILLLVPIAMALGWVIALMRVEFGTWRAETRRCQCR